MLLTYPTTAFAVLCLLDILSPFDFLPRWLMLVAGLLWALTFFRGVKLWRGQGELHNRLQLLQDDIEQDALIREGVALNNAYIILKRGVHCRQRLLWILGALMYAVVVLALPSVTGWLWPRRGDELLLAACTVLVLLPLAGVIAWPLRRMRREIQARQPIYQALLEQCCDSLNAAAGLASAGESDAEQYVKGNSNSEDNVQEMLSSSRKALIWNRQLLLQPRDRLVLVLNIVRSLAFTLGWMSAVASLSLTPAADPAGLMARLRQIALAGFTASVILGLLWIWRKRVLANTMSPTRR